MHLKVVLPTGDEVTVPVDKLSTPGHLKENLKYSIRVPPKQIRLSCDGRELDDIKPLTAEPNNLTEGSVLVAEKKEGAVEDDTLVPKASSGSKPSQTIIKKEEPPKPKKTKKDVVRPTLGDGDVVKKEVVSPGYQGWAPNSASLSGKSKKRQMVFLRLEADDRTTYPKEDEGAMMLALGDPQTSPVWTAAVGQMDIGEKAVFSMSRKAVDFDPEGLSPTDSTTWTIELLRVVEVEDVEEDFSQLLVIESSGSKERAEDLDAVAVHWRVRRWQPEGCVCIASSRERIAIIPGYGLVPIEDPNAPPVTISIGEGQQQAVELVASKVGVGGRGQLYVKSDAMKHNRPQGCVVIDVEFVAMDACRGPGSPGWKGWQSLVNERETGDQWLEEADGRRKQLETFGTLRKSTEDTKDAEAQVAEQVHKFANNAARRYRRALRWIESGDGEEDRKIKLEKSTVAMRLAKAEALSHQRFGAAGEKEASKEEKEALTEARSLLSQVLQTGEALQNQGLIYECLKMTLQVLIQAEDVPEARKVIERLLSMRPDDEELKSDSARVNRLESALSLKQGAGTVETMQKDLAAAVTAADKEAAGKILASLLDLMKNNQVTWDAVRTCKVGKDVGNAMKMGDPDLAAQARKVVGEIQALAQRNSIGL